MQLAAEIEETLIDKAQGHMAASGEFDDLDVSNIGMRDAIRLLVTHGLMPVSLSENLADFREIRNRVVHGGEGSEEEILSAIDSGLTILRLLDGIDVPDDERVEHQPPDGPPSEFGTVSDSMTDQNANGPRVDAPTLPAPDRSKRPRRRTPS
jgi:hypothetical protein